MDRLISAASWHEPQSLDQALLVATHNSERIDWKKIDTWVVSEGIVSTPEIARFYRAVQRRLP